MRMYSERGLGDEPGSVFWTVPDPDWLWDNGYPQEMEHFLECARSGDRPASAARTASHSSS